MARHCNHSSRPLPRARRRWQVACAAAVMACATIAAAADELPFAGVWTGTIGDSRVQVCFSALEAHYYYLRHLRGIPLRRNEQATGYSEWEETLPGPAAGGEVSGRWTLSSATNRVMEGAWTTPDGARRLPIKLTKIADLATDQGPASSERYPCGDAFYRPLEQALRYTHQPGRFRGVPYRVIKTRYGDAFELPASAPAATAFNRFVRSWLASQLVSAYGCTMGGGEEWHKELKPIVWTSRFLVVEDRLPDTFCGGAHSNWMVEHHTFDLTTGGRVDTWSWIQGGNKTLAPALYDHRPSALRGLLEKLNPRQDCRENDGSMYFNAPYPTKSGLVFRSMYPHVVRACEDEILVSYKRLAPYLTSAGRAAAAEMAKP